MNNKKILFLLGALVFCLFIFFSFSLMQNKKNNQLIPELVQLGDPSSAQVETKAEQNQPAFQSSYFINNAYVDQELSARLIKAGLPSGSYWYDSRSGLYGRTGEGYLGQTEPGLTLGNLSLNSSNGRSGVIINGREITDNELNQIRRLVGDVLPGRYWLDSNGNAGREGENQPLANLFRATGSSGGDNFWSSGNFGAGNYYEGNEQGYVSVPGYGPVDYGF